MYWYLEAFNSSFKGTLKLITFVASFVGSFLPYPSYLEFLFRQNQEMGEFETVSVIEVLQN